MLLTNFTFTTKEKTPHYQQLARYIKKQVQGKVLTAGTKLPSIRKLAQALTISRTTAETAYGQLVADGYVINEPKRGYFIADILPKAERQLPITTQATTAKPRYNFANNYVDAATFPAALWRRHLNNVLKNKAALSTYGSYQGESSLLQALADYSSTNRGVVCVPAQIVVGAGVQSLLTILTALLAKELPQRQLALEKPGFPQAEAIFHQNGWQVQQFTIEDLQPALPRLLYVSPSNPYKGRSLSAQQRQSLLHWCQKTDGFILEDDYNGEFRYFYRPISSLQGMSDGENIIYLGSFSRLLLPSLRISYMVLPPRLLRHYQKLGPLYNQTSSTIEQLALASFIKEGSLRRHVKKLRKLYEEKNALLRHCLETYMHQKVEVLAYESGLHIRLSVAAGLSAEELARRALKYSIRILPIKGTSEVLLSFAGIHEEDIEPAVLLLKKAWFG